MIDIRFAALARRDLERIERYYRAIDPQISLDIIDAILAATRLLRERPMAGPATSRGEERKWRVARVPYIVKYRVATDHIRILRVWHTAQRSAAT